MIVVTQRVRSAPAFAAITSALLAAAALFTPRAAHASDLVVRYDQSQLIRLPRPAAEVIIGNPSIADVAIQGGNLLAVTGKSYGVTNIIALDAQRNVIQDQRVVVERDSQSSLVLYKGAQRETYSCNPSCSPTPVDRRREKVLRADRQALRKQDEVRHRQR